VNVGARDPGLLLVLSAPSGAGKTTLARRFVAAHDDARFSISATTRPARGAERDGIDYHFVSPERFARLAAEDAFAEWAEVHGQRYGTLRATVEEALALGRIAVFDIDVQGGERIKAAWPRRAVTVFVLPPSLEELERRLRARSTDADDAIARRLAAARVEIERGVAEYDYLVVNDDLAAALHQLEAIAAHERARAAGRHDHEAARTADGLRRGRLDVARWLVR
jgi:guanylate kinase